MCSKSWVYLVTYQYHYSCSSTSLQFTKQWATVFFRSFQVGDSWCLCLRRWSRKEKLGITDAGGLFLGLASLFWQRWSDRWEANLRWQGVEARDHHRGTLKVFRFLLITSSMYQVDFFFNSFSFVSSDFKTGDFIFICHLLFKILS